MPYRLAPAVALLLGAALASRAALAAEPPAAEPQVKKALEWIAKNQFRDGSWPSGVPGEGRPGVIVVPSPGPS